MVCTWTPHVSKHGLGSSTPPRRYVRQKLPSFDENGRQGDHVGDDPRDRNCHSRPGYPFSFSILDVNSARIHGQSAVRSEPDHFASYRRSRRAHGEWMMWESEPSCVSVRGLRLRRLSGELPIGNRLNVDCQNDHRSGCSAWTM